MGDGQRFPADEGADTAGEKHTGQRGNERRNVQVMDGHTHQQPKPDADNKGEQDANRRMDPQHPGSVGDDHAGEAGYSRHGQVNAAGDQHHGHPDSGDAVIGIVNEHVDEGPQRCEADLSIHDRAESIDNEENQDGCVNHDEIRVEKLIPESLAF